MARLAHAHGSACLMRLVSWPGPRELERHASRSPCLQVALEAGLALEAVLDAVRAAAPASATSPAKEVESKLPLSARSRRPKSPGACTAGSDLPPRPCSAAAAKPPTASPGSGKAGEATGKAAGPGAASTSGAAPLDKLNERFATLQQLLVAVGPEDGDTIPAAHMGQGVHGRGETGGHAAAGMQPAEPADDSLLTNPTYQLTQASVRYSCALRVPNLKNWPKGVKMVPNQACCTHLLPSGSGGG